MKKDDKYVSKEGVTPDRNAMHIVPSADTPDLNAMNIPSWERARSTPHSDKGAEPVLPERGRTGRKR